MLGLSLQVIVVLVLILINGLLAMSEAAGQTGHGRLADGLVLARRGRRGVLRRGAARQRRVLLVWNRLIMPNGRSIVLERQPGTDAAGYAGLEDGVDYHWWDLAKAAGLSTLLSVGAELAVDDDDRLLRAIRNGGQDTINDAGQEIIRRQLNVAPTLTIRPGFPVRAIVTRDLVLEPYR